LELSQKIIGKWREDGSGMVVEYFTNKTMNMTHPTDKIRGSNTIVFSWKVIDGSKIEMIPCLLRANRPQIWTISFSQPDVMLIGGSVHRRVK
jgi:hypothetical protein